MLKIIKNGDFDPVRILGIISFIIYNFITLKHSLDHCVDFKEIDYSMGLAIILGVISAGVTFKYSKE